MGFGRVTLINTQNRTLPTPPPPPIENQTHSLTRAACDYSKAKYDQSNAMVNQENVLDEKIPVREKIWEPIKLFRKEWQKVRKS